MNLKDIQFFPLKPKHSQELSDAFLACDRDYCRFFTPFAVDNNSLYQRLADCKQDRYWGIRSGDDLVGFFMLRGFDEGYSVPSFGVFVTQKFANKGFAKLALHFCLSWCISNQLPSLMLKVHPDNKFARGMYTRAGFQHREVCPQTGHEVLEKSLEIKL